MKKLPILLFLLSATLAHGSLISIANWKDPDPYPQAEIDFLTKGYHIFFDEARPAGWISQFGSLNGGQYFFTDLFSGGPLESAQVSWDFGDTGFFMRYLSIWGFDEDGTWWHRLYQVPHKFQFQDAGDFVQLNPGGTGEIGAIAFYGGSIFNLPESTSTILLLILALLALTITNRSQLT